MRRKKIVKYIDPSGRHLPLDTAVLDCGATANGLWRFPVARAYQSVPEPPAMMGCHLDIRPTAIGNGAK